MKMDPVERSHLALLGAQAVRLALFVVATAFLGRMLGAGDFALVALVSTSFLLAQGALDMGTSTTAVVRASGARDEERGLIAALLGWRRAVSFFVAGAFAVAALASGRGATGTAFTAAAFASLVLPYGAYSVGFNVRQSFGLPMAIGLALQATFLLACIALLDAGWAGASIATLVAVREAANAWALRRAGAPLVGGAVPFAEFGPPMRALVVAALPFGVAGLAVRLAYNAGTYFLWFEGADALAPYAAADRILAPLQDVAWLLAMPFAATLGAAAARSSGELRREMGARLHFMAGLGALGAALGFALAPAIIELMYAGRYGSGSGAAIASFRWLALGMGCAAATPVLAMTQIARHRERELLAVGGLALAITLALDAWAVPRYGAEGAAACAAASCALVLALLAVKALARDELAWGWEAVPYFAPAAVALATLPWIEGSPWIQLFAGGALTFATPLVLRRLPGQRAARGEAHPA